MKRLECNREILLGLAGKVMKILEHNELVEVDVVQRFNHIVHVLGIEFERHGSFLC